MSVGRGRGRSNMPGQPPMHQQQQQQQQHQQPPPQLGGDRRELRRPMQGGATPEDLARGMGRMDIYGNQDYGNYNNSGYGGAPHMMAAPPPGPAPSADGWSSGENQYDVYDQYAQQQQQQQQQQRGHQQQQQDYMGQAAYGAQYNPQWNIGASGFVPKSSLSAAAAEFVPRVMPRNTSQWAYANQPQSATASAPYYHQTPRAETGCDPYSDGGMINPYATGGSSGGGGGSSGSSLYNIEERLSDAISTIVFMPAKLDRTATTLADKINSSTKDIETLAGLANAVIDRCFSEVSFQPLAGRFCATLANSVTIAFETTNMLSLLIERCQALHRSHLDWLSSDPASARFILEFMAHFLYYIDVYGCRKVEKLVDILFEMFNTLFTIGSVNPENLKIAADMLKICGRALENDERRRNGSPDASDEEIKKRSTPKLDQLMDIVSKIANDDEKYRADVRKELKDLLDARSNGTWGSETCLPAMPTAAETAKPRSNAIVIEPDPNDLHRGGNNSSSNRNNIVLSNNARNARHPSNNEMALTEEEMAFMNEHLGAEDNSPGDSDVVGDRISMSGDDEEDEMGDDIRAAYEDFLQEQASKHGSS